MTMWKGRRGPDAGGAKSAAAAMAPDRGVSGPLWHAFALTPPPAGAQMRLPVSQPGDPYEREAESVADQVMRGGEPSPAASTAGPVVQRACAGCQEEEEKQRPVMRAAMPGAAAPGSTGAGATGAAADGVPGGPLGNGAPLDAATRAFMEPRFGADFSGVRVHADARAASSSAALGAYAYTLGSDVVFGAGQYAPSTQAGRHLLAHELAHVVQQSGGRQRLAPRARPAREAEAEAMLPAFPASAGAPSLSALGGPAIQRAKIPHRALTWADFQAKVPKGATFEAATLSDWNDPDIDGAMPSKMVATAGAACTAKVGKKMAPGITYTVDIPVDDSKLGVSAYFWQEKSWHKEWTTDRKERLARCDALFVAKCAKSLSGAEKNVDAQATAAEASCKQGFAKGFTSWWIDVGGKKVEASSADDCTNVVAPAVKAGGLKSISWTAKMGGKEVKVLSSVDCKKTFPDQCADVLMQAGADALLAHEQGHFDVTNVRAGQAAAALKALVAGFDKSVSFCQPDPAKAEPKAVAAAEVAGKAAALKLATSKVASERAQLQKEYAKWRKTLSGTQGKYDTETKHGTVEAKQDAWNQDIAKGLP